MATGLCPNYLPGIANFDADVLSCNQVTIEWCIGPELAKWLFQFWVIPRSDLLASSANTHLPVFFSIDCRDERALGIDALQ